MQGAGISPNSRGDNSLPTVGFTQRKLHETRPLLQATHESDGCPRQPHGTRQRAKLSWEKQASSLLCQRDGAGDEPSAASPASAAVTFRSPRGSGAQTSIPSPATWLGTPHPIPTREGTPTGSSADPSEPKAQRGLNLGDGAAERLKMPSAMLELSPQARSSHPAHNLGSAVAKGSALPRGPPISFKPASQNHFCYFFPPPSTGE